MRPSKRNELVSKALDVFYTNGFHSTGMDMIVEETGISKTSIYNHFRTKDDLILAVLRLRDERFRNWLFRRMAELADTPEGQLLAMFDALREWFQTPDFKGCMFIKATSEYQDPCNPIFKQSKEHKVMIEQHVERLAALAKISESAKLARQLMLLKEGAIIAAHMDIQAEPAKEARMAAVRLLADSK